MSLKPSKYLLEEFRQECKQKCRRFRFLIKPAAIEWEFQKCVEKCVQNTIEKERPILI
jgi:hypothetical protein